MERRSWGGIPLRALGTWRLLVLMLGLGAEELLASYGGGGSDGSAIVFVLYCSGG